MDQATSNTSRRSYSVQYLKSFAENCRESPPDIHLQEINLELEDVNSEWTKTSFSPSSVSPGKHPRRRRNRKHASLHEGANSKGVPSDIALRARNGGFGFSSDGQREPKTNDEPIFTERTISKEAMKNISKFDRNRLALAPLKLKDHVPWIADHDNDNKNLANKFKQEASSSDEFYIAQKVLKHPKLVQAMQTSDSGDTSPGSCSSEKKINLDSLFVKERHHRAKPMPTAPTVQDIEKEILTDKETSEGETLTSPEDLGSSNQWKTDQDKAASEHILSVLRKKKEPGGESEKELLGELISSNPISSELSNLDDVLKHYEKIAASDFQHAESELKPDTGAVEPKPSSSTSWRKVKGLACSSTVVDSMRTSVKAAKMKQDSDQKSKTSSSRKSFQPWYWAPNAFVQTNGMMGSFGGAPLVPQALNALQRLVDHQLHILNSIPGEVTPGMLHERLSRSILGYPPTGTHLVFTTYLR